MNVDSS